jgi:hypothetical protein
MRIILESEVATSKRNFFAFPFYTFNGQNRPTKYFKVPLLQRDYVWPKEGSVAELLTDLHEHIKQLSSPSVPIPKEPADNSVYYYTGTILCESQLSLTGSSEEMALVDGQQRITTLYLMNYVGYLLSRFSLENIPVVPPKQYPFIVSSRFLNLTTWENRCFIKNGLSDNVGDIFDDTSDELVNELTKSFEIRIGSQKQKRYLDSQLWQKVSPRIVFSDTKYSDLLNAAIQKFNLIVGDGDNISHNAKAAFLKNPYALGISVIIEHLNEITDTTSDIDEKINLMMLYLESYISHLAMTCIISESENDSFILFEILNERGQDLTALDLVKNMLLERNLPPNPIPDKEFASRWDNIKLRVSSLGGRGKADSTFVKYFIRSEGSTTKNKQIAYLRNRPNSGRLQVFQQESTRNLFLRMEKASEILARINDNSESAFSASFSGSCFQYATFMRMLGYDWGQQAVIGSNILFLCASNYSHPPFGVSNSLNDDNNWTTISTSSSAPDLKHFARFLGDILLKVGLIGIVNKMSEGILPEDTQKILSKIIECAEMNGPQCATPQNLRQLIREIQAIATDRILNQQNQAEFYSRLTNEFYANTSSKKVLARVLLYLIYSRNSILSFENPQLEHFEPEKPPSPINPPYYNEGDRSLIISKLGNLFLIDGQINSDFSNKSIVQKLSKVLNEYPTYPVFQTNLFKNVDFNQSPPVINDPIHGQLPLIKKSIGPTPGPLDAFRVDDTPTKYFFSERTRLLSTLASRYIFESSAFLRDGTPYLT